MGSYAYDQQHTARVSIKLNTTTDADILEHLDKQPNKQGYIKALIREDIQKEERKMAFTGYIGSDFCSFTLDNIGRLIVTRPDGTEDTYNEEYYDDDQYETIRSMLIRDGVRELHG